MPYLPAVRMAFKEWAVVVDALGRGEQILILRKGGIREASGGFQVEYPQFAFFPTLFHQQRDAVLPGAQARFDEIARRFAPPEILRVEFSAEIVAWRKLESLDAAQRLRGQHIWRDEVVAERFGWGKATNIVAMAVRVSRLPSSIELPMRPEYGGCKSWIELEADIDVAGARPVLNDSQFAQKLAQFHAALQAAHV